MLDAITAAVSRLFALPIRRVKVTVDPVGFIHLMVNGWPAVNEVPVRGAVIALFCVTAATMEEKAAAAITTRAEKRMLMDRWIS